MNLRQAKKTLAKKVWDAAGMAGGDFAPKWVGQGIPARRGVERLELCCKSGLATGGGPYINQLGEPVDS